MKKRARVSVGRSTGAGWCPRCETDNGRGKRAANARALRTSKAQRVARVCIAASNRAGLQASWIPLLGESGKGEKSARFHFLPR